MIITRFAIGLFVAVVLAGCAGPSASVSSAPSLAAASASRAPSLVPAPASAPTPSPTVETAAEPSASTQPTPAPTGRPRPAPPSLDPKLPPKPDFPKGAFVETATDGLRVRSKPGVSADSVKYEPVLPRGSYLIVLAGPEPASGYWWYRVQVDEGATLRGGVSSGWVAASDHDGKPWIRWVVDTDPGS